jgi:hypothetical protein
MARRPDVRSGVVGELGQSSKNADCSIAQTIMMPLGGRARERVGPEIPPQAEKL